MRGIKLSGTKSSAHCTPVMLLHNLDVANGWTNGTLCLVTELRETFILVNRLADNQPMTIFQITRDIYQSPYSRTQFPLVPSFASTIHKIQSLTLDGGVAVSINKPFISFGQFYVACSRVHSANQLYFFGMERAIQTGVDRDNSDYLRLISN